MGQDRQRTLFEDRGLQDREALQGKVEELPRPRAEKVTANPN